MDYPQKKLPVAQLIANTEYKPRMDIHKAYLPKIRFAVGIYNMTEQEINQEYFKMYIKGTYPTNGKPDNLQSFHHHMSNEMIMIGQNASLILCHLPKYSCYG